MSEKFSSGTINPKQKQKKWILLPETMNFPIYVEHAPFYIIMS